MWAGRVSSLSGRNPTQRARKQKKQLFLLTYYLVLFAPWLKKRNKKTFKTARLQEQLPSELNSWSRDQKQFMQNSKVRWKASNDNIQRKTSLWNKAWRSHDAPLAIWLELRNEHISRSTKRPPFSLICPDRESNGFLNLDIWWFDWFSLLQCSYTMKLRCLMCFLVMTNNPPEWPLLLGGQDTIFTF